MQLQQDLRDKWRRRLERGEGGCCFGLDKLAPGKFYVLYNDFGTSGPCCSNVLVVGVFEDARDCLGFLRASELPRLLDFDTGTLRQPFPDVADAYLVKYEGGQREKIDNLLGRLDLVLQRDAADMISEPELCLIRDLFNQIFSQTSRQVAIEAWGSLADVLASDHFEEAFEEEIEDEADEQEKPVTTLRKLLRDGQFNENDREHLDLAKDFLEQTVTF